LNYVCALVIQSLSVYIRHAVCLYIFVVWFRLIQEYCFRSAAAFLIEADGLTRLTCGVALAVKIN